MTTTLMWHPTRATDLPVYHDDTRCPEGSAIDLPYRQPGDGGYTSCEYCMELLVQTNEGGHLGHFVIDHAPAGRWTG